MVGLEKSNSEGLIMANFLCGSPRYNNQNIKSSLFFDESFLQFQGKKVNLARKVSEKAERAQAWL